MPTFLNKNCIQEEINFFHSGAYIDPSFSTTWSTLTVPDIEGINTPVYQQVLDQFNITIDSTGGLPPGGTLPGIDIKRMDAIQAIRLSLAEAFLNNQWWELYEDGEGGVFFQQVFNAGSPGKSVNLNVRLCLPSASKDNEVNMVIVRGYQYPPQRFIKEFRDVVPAGTGTINPDNVSGVENVFTVYASDLLEDVCHSKFTDVTVIKSYKDPVLIGDFSPQAPNPFYEVQAFERLLGYVHKVTGLPDTPDSAARVKFSLSATTPWYKELDFPNFSPKSVPECTNLPQHGTITYFEGTVNYTTTNYSDRYGTQSPLVIRPTGLFYTGNKLIEVNSIAGIKTIMIVDPVTEFNSLNAGSNWVWNSQGINSYKIVMFYQPQLDPTTWEDVLNATSLPTEIRYSDGQGFTTDKANSLGLAPGSSQNILGIPGGGLGYLISKMWLVLELDRPSVIITTTEDVALEYAASLRIQYAPIILKQEPAPIAYHHRDNGSQIVDQSQGLVDADPTTCQNFEETDLERMQDLSTGQVIDVSLPFCKDGGECLAAAQTIFNYMDYAGIQTYTLTCGPDDEPELGAHVNGFSADLRIQSINYSYSDSSHYTIEVTLGPVFNNVGSWNNNSAWVRRTEQVQRKGIIKWVSGDGVNYRVDVQGLGVFNAVNGVDSVFYPGELVTVTIDNIPIEE